MFRFTLRDVLWLTVVVGLGLGWWMETRKSASLRADYDERSAAVEELYLLGLKYHAAWKEAATKLEEYGSQARPVVE